MVFYFATLVVVYVFLSEAGNRDLKVTIYVMEVD